MQRLLLFLFIMTGLLVACNPEPTPLVIVATPNAPDAGFRVYEHPTGVFSIRVPPAWIPDQLPDPDGIRVQFTSVEGNNRVVRLSIYVVNTGQALTNETFLQTLRTYQAAEEAPWTAVTEPNTMADGSVRLIGVRHYEAQGDRAMNIFVQPNGSYFSALELDVTDIDTAVTQTLMAAVNTYTVNPNAQLQIGNVAPIGVTSQSGVLTFQHYTHWQDVNGGFNITGQVTNEGDQPLEAIRLTAYLYDMDGRQLAERSDILSYDVLAPGASAPFRLRFDTGRPSTAVRYELQAAARGAEFALATFYGNENFIIPEDFTTSTYTSEGYLTISGMLQNNSTRLATSIKVIALALDANGQIIGTESTFLTKDQLQPGEAAPFEITIYDMGGTALNFKLLAQGTAP